MSVVKLRNFTRLILGIPVALAVALVPLTANSEGDVALAQEMSHLQGFMHKTGLSLRAGNMEAADFYVHEIEETLDVVMTVEEYDGYPIGELVKTMLVPSFESFEDALRSGDSTASLEAYLTVIETCNACHTVTAHGFIKIEDRSHTNPFMQSF